MRSIKRIFQFTLTLMIVEMPSYSAQISIKSATDSVMNVVAEVAAIIFPVLGLIGIGRAAFTFSTGGQGGTKELLEGIVGVGLGIVAKMLAGS